MRKPLLLGLPALAAASSCVPADPPRVSVVVPAASVAPQPVADNRQLLRRMALAVPDDLAAEPTLLPLPEPAVAAAPPFVAAAMAPDDADRATECLTAAIYYEARSEPLDGQRAVAQVVLNRVRDRAFPATVCGVVYQGSARHTGCQFSFTCDGSMLRPRDAAAWARSRMVAQMALSGSVYAPVGAATSYHANYVLPWWAPSLSRVATVGSHIFYRWRDGMDRALTFRQAYAGGEPITASAMTADDGAAEVAIHVGTEDGGLVTVHRGTAPPAAVEPEVAAATPRLLTVSGVRVHRGADPHAGADIDAEVSESDDPS